jgi:tetratricopeptide (TPR) repeat protein
VQVIAATAAPAGNWVGRRIGPYRIVREIGRGGMGLVFEAVRDDEYHKRVALKVAPWWRDAALVVDRFRLERQILAELEHPNIARFLDGGSQDGVPYFVMEYVEGQPITTYCDQHQLGLRERIALVRQICGAVHYAHESLVVHRDLKPANILVGEDGTPKLLDFGIAKLLDPLADTSTTTTGVMMWTPDYTSPEQVRGRPVTVRTDVYSLGLILYELLAGERGQKADPTSPLTLDRTICEIDPGPPSEGATARGAPAIARRLRGDLDTIVMTAISKEPERRYGSAAALSDDLGRHLDGRPILARPGTLGYRAGKLLRRHRVGAVAALFVVLSIAGGMVATLYQARRAERRFQQVRALANTFVFDVHDRIETLPGSTEARKAIVQTALTYLENLRADAGADRALGLELAAAYEKVGNVQGDPLGSNLGDTDGAIASYRRAEEIAAPLASRGDRDAMLRLASVAHRRAVVRLAQGDLKDASAAFATAREVGERLVATNAADREALNLLGEVYANSSRASFQLRDYAAAERDAQGAMTAARALLKEEPASRIYQNSLATAYNSMGTARMAAGRLQDAADSYRRSVELRERLVDEEPTNTEYRRNLLVSYGILGDVLGYRAGENLGETQAAADAFAKSVEIAEWARSRDPADRRSLFDLASARIRLGTLFLEGEPGQPAAALTQFVEVKRLITTLLASDPKSDRYGFLAVVLDRRMGETFAALGRTDEAMRHLDASRSAAHPLLGGPNGANARTQLVLAGVRLAMLRARGPDPAARTLAELVSSELAGKPIGPPLMQAAAHADAGRAFAAIAKGERAAERVQHLQRAVTHLEKSIELWRGATVAKAVEPRRARDLAAAERDLADCRRQLSST